MPKRYDDYVEFHNPTTIDFVGRWEQEDYIIGAGETDSYPGWLARHFAKRLCDQVMIKKHGEPLRPGHPKRDEFMATCLPGVALEMVEDETPKSTKAQIEAGRKNIAVSKEERKAQLKAELAALDEDEDEDEANTPDDEEVDAPEDEEVPFDEDEDEDDTPLTPEAAEAKAAAEVRADGEASAKAIKSGKAKNIPSMIGKGEKPSKERAEAPSFEGDVGKADSKMHSDLQEQLAKDPEA